MLWKTWYGNHMVHSQTHFLFPLLPSWKLPWKAHPEASTSSFCFAFPREPAPTLVFLSGFCPSLKCEDQVACPLGWGKLNTDTYCMFAWLTGSHFHLTCELILLSSSIPAFLFLSLSIVSLSLALFLHLFFSSSIPLSPSQLIRNKGWGWGRVKI